jgi:hypothetical protein
MSPVTEHIPLLGVVKTTANPESLVGVRVNVEVPKVKSEMAPKVIA